MVNPVGPPRDLDESLEKAEEELERCRGASDVPGEVAALVTIAGLHLAKAGSKQGLVDGSAELALQAAEEARALAQELDDQRLEAEALLALAEAQAVSTTAEQALETADEALDLYLELKDKPMEAQVLLAMSRFHLASHAPSRALSDAEDALEICQAFELPEELDAMKAVFLAHCAKGDLRKAKLAVSEGVRRFREKGFAEGQAVAVQLLVDSYVKACRWDEVIPAAEKALPMLRDLKDKAREVKTLSLLCQAQVKMGKAEKAQELGEEALRIVRENMDDMRVMRETATAVQNLCEAYQKLKHNEDALSLSTEMREHFKQLGDASSEGTCLACMCAAQFLLGDLEGAQISANRAHILLSEVGNAAGEARALRLLGEIHWKKKEHKASVRIGERARALFRELQDSAGEACAVYMIAQNSVHVSVKEGAKVGGGGQQPFPKAARDALEKATKLAETGVKMCRGVPRLANVLASVLGSLAQARLLAGKKEESLRAADEAILLFRDSGDYGGEANSLMLSCDSLRSMGRYQDAAEAADEALTLYQHIKDQRGQELALEILDWLRQYIQPAARPAAQQWQQPRGAPVQQQQYYQGEDGQEQESGMARRERGPTGPALDKSAMLDSLMVRNKVLEIAADITGAGDGEIEADTPLMEAGLTSNSAILLRDRLTQELQGISLPVTLVFDYPSITAMSELIVESSMRAIKG